MELSHPQEAGLVFLNGLYFAIQKITARQPHLKGFALLQVKQEPIAVALLPKLILHSLFGEWENVHGKFSDLINCFCEFFVCPKKVKKLTLFCDPSSALVDFMLSLF